MGVQWDRATAPKQGSFCPSCNFFVADGTHHVCPNSTAMHPVFEAVNGVTNDQAERVLKVLNRIADSLDRIGTRMP